MTPPNGKAASKPQPKAVPPPGTDTEVVPRARRRNFLADYKRRILQEADRCPQSGQAGALLRRENERLRKRLEKAETIMAVQKKLSDLLGVTSDAPPKGDSR